MAPRIAAVAVCCLLAALSPFVAGIRTAVPGLLLLAYAVWLVFRSPWSLATRLAVAVAAVATTGALAIGVLILATATSGD